MYVTPLFKRGSRCDAANYRPVTLTSHVVKVYERVVRKHIVQYLDANNLLSDKQHGFRSYRSCLTQMLDHFDSIFEGFSQGNDTDSTYLDFAEAFDKVDRELLFLKLKRYGFHRRLIGWIQSFLTDREQVVVVKGVHSNSAKVLSGVPQGSVLGPHISNMVTKARSTLSWVFSVFKTLDRTVLMITFYKSLVRSLLEYCCPQWDPTKATDIQMLKGVQRTFTSRKIKFIETLRHGTKAVILSLSKCSSPRNQTLYDSSFAVRGPKLWKKVPVAIKTEKKLACLKLSFLL